MQKAKVLNILITDYFIVSYREKPVEKESEGHRPESCLLLPQAPPRGGLKPKTHKKTNMHIVVEFGIQVSVCAVP